MKKKIIGTILTLLCTSVVAFSGWQVYKIMSEYQSGEKVYLELEEYVSPPTEEKNTDHQTESSESENKTILPVVEFEKLKSINNDFVAWIYCEGTAINYPVVHYKDNTYYLSTCSMAVIIVLAVSSLIAETLQILRMRTT